MLLFFLGMKVQAADHLSKLAVSFQENGYAYDFYEINTEGDNFARDLANKKYNIDRLTGGYICVVSEKEIVPNTYKMSSISDLSHYKKYMSYFTETKVFIYKGNQLANMRFDQVYVLPKLVYLRIQSMQKLVFHFGEKMSLENLQKIDFVVPDGLELVGNAVYTKDYGIKTGGLSWDNKSEVCIEQIGNSSTYYLYCNGGINLSAVEKSTQIGNGELIIEADLDVPEGFVFCPSPTAKSYMKDLEINKSYVSGIKKIEDAQDEGEKTTENTVIQEPSKKEEQSTDTSNNQEDYNAEDVVIMPTDKIPVIGSTQESNDNISANDNGREITYNKKGKGKIKVFLKKIKGAKGYQLKISTSKKFKRKSTKSYILKGTQKVIKNLKRNKKYYIKYRSFQYKRGKRQYSKWYKTKTFILK